jgi:glycosyltransferase involved in cell wall biosynthesis
MLFKSTEMKPFPYLSIITPSFNRADMIADSIKSAQLQNYSNFEHIIIDGGSTDGTLDILNKYPHLRVITEPDNGMYDALNKGLALAKGEIIGFLNSDDEYAENAFNEVIEKFQNDQGYALAGGAEIFQNITGTDRKVLQSFLPEGTDLLELATIGSPFFNAWFFRRNVFEKLGSFDISYRIAADREFMLRFALSGLEYTIFNQVVYRYRYHAGSMTFDISDQKLNRITREHIQMTNIYLQKPDLPEQARQLIRQSRTLDTLEMAAHSLRNGNLHEMPYFMIAGMRYDLAWVVKFSKRTLARLWMLFLKK